MKFMFLDDGAVSLVSTVMDDYGTEMSTHLVTDDAGYASACRFLDEGFDGEMS